MHANGINPCKIHNVIERQWCGELSVSQQAVLRFVTDRTIPWNKEWEIITLRQFLEGIVSKAGEVIHKGIRLSKRAIQYALKELVEQGYILKREVSRWGRLVNQYAINLERLNMALPTPKKDRTKAAASLLPQRRQDMGISEAPKDTTLELQSGEIDEDVWVQEVHPSSATVAPYNSTKETVKNFSKNRERESAPFGKRVLEKVEEARERYRFALKRKSQRHLSNYSIEAAWKASMLENWESVRILSFTGKDHGNAKRLFKDLGKETISFLEWCVSNWHLVRRAKFSKSKTLEYPDYPDFGFLFAFRHAFVDVWNERHYHERLANHPKAALVVHLRKQGYTFEQALEHVEVETFQDKRAAELSAKAKRLAKQEERLRGLPMPSVNPGSSGKPMNGREFREALRPKRSTRLKPDHELATVEEIKEMFSKIKPYEECGK